VHDAPSVIWRMHVEPLPQVKLHEIWLDALFDIVPLDFDVLVAIGSRLRVEETESVEELVDDAAVSSHARADRNLLLSAFAADEAPAAISWILIIFRNIR
jgi:hypothetical protein